jgi:hypothetical protein
LSIGEIGYDGLRESIDERGTILRHALVAVTMVMMPMALVHVRRLGCIAGLKCRVVC